MPLILLSGITGIGTTVCAWWIARLGTWQNDCLRAMMEWPYAVAHTDWSLWFTVWCYVVLCVRAGRNGSACRQGSLASCLQRHR
jgi:competence protein ComEC